jgi:hypothetical protein
MTFSLWFEAASHIARKAAEAAAADTANKHAEYERLNSALKEAEKESRQATDDLRDSTSSTSEAGSFTRPLLNST